MTNPAQATAPSELGPAPTAAGPAVVSAAQAEVLDRLREHFLPVTAAALAREHGLHTNTVREHLDVLVGRGLASRAKLASGGRGRPSFGYTATSALSDLQAHAALVDALSDHLAATAADPAAAAEQLGRRYAGHGQEAADRGAENPVGSDTGTALHVLEAAMQRFGFGPEVDEDAGVARLRTCPLLPAARRHQDVVCGFHRGLALGMLEGQGHGGLGVVLEAFAEPGACLLSVTTAGATAPTATDSTETAPTATGPTGSDETPEEADTP